MTRAAVDTSALLALASSRDQYHKRALAADAAFRRRGGKWVGTTLVLAELHGHLIRHLEPQAARRVISALLADAAYDWRDATLELARRASDGWMARFADQRFSLTRAATFELMDRERIRHAFAYEQDFVTAGFELLG
ncbi:MAG: type II toxin-antitoxin system VapC family toxin [Gemmatimonadales bacterium]